jgi:hypothetical protein
MGGWVDPRAGPDDVEKRKFLTPPGLELRPLGRPASSQSLYRLRYLGYSLSIKIYTKNDLFTKKEKNQIMSFRHTRILNCFSSSLANEVHYQFQRILAMVYYTWLLDPWPVPIFCYSEQNIVFQKLDLFPSSGEIVGEEEHLHRCVRQK